MKRILIYISAAALSLNALAQSITTNGFYPPVVRKGQAVKYTIALKDADADISPADIPAPKELQYIGSGVQSRMSITNMQNPVREKILTFNYIPTQDGEFEIGEWEVSSGGKKYKIAPAKLKVDPNAPAPQNAAPDPFEEMEEMMSNFGFSQFPSVRRQQMAQRAPRQTIDLQSEIKAQAKLIAGEIYVGQAVLCEVSFKFSKNFRLSQCKLANLVPSIKNSDAFVCNGFLKNPETRENEDGSTDIVFLTVVSPLKAGEFNIQFEGVAVVLENSFGFFGAEKSFAVLSPEKIVKISELPKENMPADFSGAIGKFKIESAKLDENSLSVGEPCVMDITISGEGNFDRFSAPELENPQNWKGYKPKISFKDQSGGYACIGEKTFSYTLVPSKPDLEKTPAASFNFFNPDTRQYEVLKSGALPVSVAPSKSYAKKELSRGAAEESESAGIINGGASASNAQNSIASSPYFWGVQGAILALLCAAAIRRSRKNRLLDDPLFAQAQISKKSVKKNLSLAKSAAQKNAPKEFFEAGARALQNALSLSSGMPAGAITRDDAISIMQKIGCHKTGLAAKIFDGADAVSFGGYTPETGEIGNLFTELEKLCKELSQN